MESITDYRIIDQESKGYKTKTVSIYYNQLSIEMKIYFTPDGYNLFSNDSMRIYFVNQMLKDKNNKDEWYSFYEILSSYIGTIMDNELYNNDINLNELQEYYETL